MVVNNEETNATRECGQHLSKTIFQPGLLKQHDQESKHVYALEVVDVFHNLLTVRPCFTQGKH